MATLTPSAKQQFFDANGNPLAGGKLYTYAAGTTTPLVTYTNSDGITANTNPIILDSRGEANIWLGSAAYKFKLTTSTDVELWTVDNVEPDGFDALQALAASNGSSLIGFVQSGTGASTSTVQTKLREVVSVKDFGAVGDGVTDDTSAIQATLTYAEANNKSIFAPAGRYKITSQLTYAVTSTNADYSSGIVLTGDGMGKTVFINAVAGAPMLFVSSTSPYFAKGNRYSDFTIVGDGVATSQTAIRSKGAWYTIFQNIRIIKVLGSGVVIGDDSTTINPDDTANSSVIFDGCELDQNLKAINNPVNNNAPMISLRNTSLRNNTEVGLVANSSHIVIENCSISFNGSAGSPSALGGVHIEERAGTTFSAGYRSKDIVIRSSEIDSNAPYNINIQQAERVLIEQNTIAFRDYAGTWMANLSTWPPAQIQIGGATNTKRVLGAIIRNNRVGLTNDGNIVGGMNGHAILRIGAYGQNVKWSDQTFDISSGSGVMGTDFYLIREDSKAGTSPDLSAPIYAVDYDYPIVNGNSSWLQTNNGFLVNYRKVFPAQFTNTQYQFLMTDDSAQAITVPNATSEAVAGTNYGFFLITVAGAATRSDLIGYRATGGPACFKIGSASTDINVTTGALNGTTGTDGKFTVSANTDNKVYLENRLGASLYVNVAFLVYPGLISQPVF